MPQLIYRRDSSAVRVTKLKEGEPFQVKCDVLAIKTSQHLMNHWKMKYLTIPEYSVGRPKMAHYHVRAQALNEVDIFSVVFEMYAN